jgi:NAD-dependent SIR2 family protein deacetylase
MVGWKKLDTATPNSGHQALAALERTGWLGVRMEDRIGFYEDSDRDEFLFSTGQRRLSIITQNVDSLHQRAGSNDVLQLHGGGKVVRCMNCGYRMDRNHYHRILEDANRDWLLEQGDGLTDQQQQDKTMVHTTRMRPDGDAQLRQDTDYSQIHLPACPNCTDGFFKPDVVFFGDTVPKHRVRICQEAVASCSGVLVVGTSLTVHSAY